MNHRMLRMPAGWEWHMLTVGRAPSDGAARPRPGSALPGTDRPWPGSASASAEQPRPGSAAGPEQAQVAAATGPEQTPAASSRPQAGPEWLQTDPAQADPKRPRTGAALPGAGRPPHDAMQPGPAQGMEQPESAPGAVLPGTMPADVRATAARATQYAGAPRTEARSAVQSAGMTRAAALTAIKRQLPECANWLDGSLERRDTLAVSTETPDAGDTVYGTLPLRMSPDEHDVCPLHYWLTEKRLVTLQFDLRFTLRLQRSPWEERLERAASAPEAFAVILTAALDTMRGGFEAFERRLAGLEAAAERSGRPIPVETLAELQRGLLQWNRHLLAVVEAESAAAESFGKRLTEGEPYRRLQRRLGRVRALIGRHAEAIEALTALSGAASMQKSGSLLKALTAVIVLPAPAAAAGALWGMNAGGVPLADERWGFAAICGGAALLSLALYAWLRRMTRTGPARAEESGGRVRHTRASARIAAAQDGDGIGGAGQAGQSAAQAGLPSRTSRRKRR